MPNAGSAASDGVTAGVALAAERSASFRRGGVLVLTRLSELEAQLRDALSRPVADRLRIDRLTLAIEQERWLDQYGPTDRERD